MLPGEGGARQPLVQYSITVFSISRCRIALREQDAPFSDSLDVALCRLLLRHPHAIDARSHTSSNLFSASDGRPRISCCRFCTAREPTLPPPTDWTRRVPRERFAGPFAAWVAGGLCVADLIAATDPDAVFESPMCDRDPVCRWTSAA